MDQVRALFDGLELVEPGLVIVPDWRPEPPAVRDHPVLEMACVGVARKPRPLRRLWSRKLTSKDLDDTVTAWTASIGTSTPPRR